MRRRFGRPCRGMGSVCVTLVRQTATPWLQGGQPVLPLGQAAPAYRHGATPLSADQRVRLDPQLTAARDAPQRIAPHSRRLTQGRALAQGKIVNASEPTMAPSCQGNSNGPAPFGRQPGMIAEPAAGVLLAWPLPVGNPGEIKDGEPLVDKVPHASARVANRPPAIPSLAGELARKDATLREALQARGMRTAGLPKTVEPLPTSPPAAEVLRPLDEADVPGRRPPSQVDRACACGASRPVIARVMASLRCRGAAPLTDQGPHGAIGHTGMAVMAHQAATLVRIHASRLAKRARMCRRRLRLRCPQVNQRKASIN